MGLGNLRGHSCFMQFGWRKSHRDYLNNREEITMHVSYVASKTHTSRHRFHPIFNLIVFLNFTASNNSISITYVCSEDSIVSGNVIFKMNLRKCILDSRSDIVIFNLISCSHPHSVPWSITLPFTAREFRQVR